MAFRGEGKESRHEGKLEKRSPSGLRLFQDRIFVLDKISGCLSYFKNEKDVAKNATAGRSVGFRIRAFVMIHLTVSSRFLGGKTSRTRRLSTRSLADCSAFANERNSA